MQRRSRRRSGWLRTDASGFSWRANSAPERLARGVLAFSLVVSAVVLGGAHPGIVVIVGLVVCTASGLIIATAPIRRWPLPACVLGLLGLYSAVQAAPIPLTVLELLSPQSAYVWKGALSPLGETVRYGALSLEPQASLVEAVKWLVYALTFCLADIVARGRGGSWGLKTVARSAALVAVGTLVHRVLDLERVFGVYEPIGGPASESIGPILNPNTLAGYSAAGALCCLAVSVRARDRWVRCAWLAVATGLAGMVILTQSKGGIGALALGTAVFSGVHLEAKYQWFAAHVRSMRWVVGGGLALLPALAVVVAVNFHRIVESVPSLSKLAMVVWVRPVVRDFPVFGIGRGAFESVFAAYRTGSSREVYSHAENWMLQWLVEWGIVFAAPALIVLCLLLSPRHLGWRRSATALGATTAVGALVVQNFVDLGLELLGPGIVVAVLLGTSHGAAGSNRRNDLAVPARRGFLFGMAAFGCVVCIITASRGTTSLAHERKALFDEFRQLGAGGRTEVKVFEDKLRDAMVRRPAESYFPRLGAMLALRAPEMVAMPWASRALERCPSCGRAHLVLAQVLRQEYNALHQALLHTRMAVEHSPDLAEAVGRLVSNWTHDPRTILTGFPRSAAGALGIRSAADSLCKGQLSMGCIELLHLAQTDFPQSPELQRACAARALQGLRSGTCERSDRRLECQGYVMESVASLRRIDPMSAQGEVLLADLYELTKYPSDAAEQLQRRCSQLIGSAQAQCYVGLLRVLELGPDDRAEAALIARRLGSFGCERIQQCAEVLHRAGMALLRTGEHKLAVQYLERAVAEQPSAERLIALADAAEKAGQLARADLALGQAAHRAARDPELLKQIAIRRNALAAAALAR